MWVAAALLLAGCGGGSGVVQAEDGGGAPTGTWLSTSVRDDGPDRSIVEGHKFSLDFRDDGQVSASGDCNISTGTLRMAEGRLWVEGMGSTLMGCPGAGRHERDAWLMKFLESGPSVTFDEARIELSTPTAAMSLAPREVVDPDLPLEGTTWKLTTITDGPPPGAADDTNASVSGGAVPGTGGELVFKAGRMSGTLDCVKFAGTAVAAEGTITFSRVKFSRSKCATGGEKVADPVFAVLEGDVLYDINARALTLTHASGRGLALTAEEPSG